MKNYPTALLAVLLAIFSAEVGSGLHAQQQNWDATRLFSAEEEVFKLADLDFDRARVFAEQYGSDCPNGQQAYCRILKEILLGLYATFLPRTDQGVKVRAYFAHALRESARAGFGDLHARAAIAQAREFAIIHQLDSSLVLLNDAQEVLSGKNEPLLFAELEKVYGITYALALDKGKAQEHYRSGLDWLDKLPKSKATDRARARLLHNLGFLYHYYREYPLALKHMEEAYTIRRANGFELEIPMLLGQMASALALNGQSNRAEGLFVMAESLSLGPGQYNFRIVILSMYADFIYKRGQFAKALSLAQEIERVARLTRMLNTVELSLRQQSKFCAALGRYKEAYRFQQRASLMNDSLRMAKTALDLSQIEARFREISDARTKDALRHQLSERSFFLRMLTVGAVGTVLLLIALAIFLSARLRSNRLLRRRAQQLELANADKNRLFSMLAHDLRTPLYALYDLLEKKKKVNAYSAVDLEADMQRLQQKVANTRSLLDNFLIWAAMESKGPQHRFEPVELRPLVEEELVTMADEARLLGISLVGSALDHSTALVDAKMIRFVLQSLIANAIQLTLAGGKVEVSLLPCQSQDRVRIGLRISGWDPKRGLTQPYDSGQLNMGSSADSSLLFGLSLAQTFLSYHGAALETHAEPDGALLRWFELPLING